MGFKVKRLVSSKSKIVMYIAAVFTAAVVLCGCAPQSTLSLDEFVFDNEGVEGELNLDWITVQCADLDTSIRIDLLADTNAVEYYFPPRDDMEIVNMACEVGDTVHEGDLLLEYKTGDEDEEIRKAKKAIDEDMLLIEHIQKMKLIYKSKDYSAEEARLLKDIENENLKIEEFNDYLSSFTVRAKADGVVTEVSPNYSTSKVGTEDCVLKVNYSSGEFYGITDSDYEFEIGEEYEAAEGELTHRMILTNIEQTGEDNLGRVNRKLYFKQADTQNLIPDTSKIQIVIESPVHEDSIFVPYDAVKSIDSKNFVFVLDQNDIPILTEVKVGVIVDSNMEILGGLKENDRVVKGVR